MAELVHRLLERNARKYPTEAAVRYPAGEVSWTWRDLNTRANALAHYLMGQGLQAGDRVALLIPNRPSFLQAYFGALKAGAVVVPVNAKLTAGEVAHILQDSGASALIFEEALEATAQAALQQAEVGLVVNTGELEARIAGISADDPGLEGGLDDTAEIIYTSGTTGRPKGVQLSHNAVHSVASMMAYEVDIRYRDRVLILMPLTHSAPLNLMMAGAVYAGATCVLGDFLPQALLELTDAERTTHFFGAPVAYLLAARTADAGSYDLSSVKAWIYGGAPMSREAVQTIRARFPVPFVSVYGLTESGPNGMALHPWEHETRAGSIGRAGVVNVEVRVVDEQGRDVAPGGVGEIIMRTPSAMTGYYRNPEATAEVLRDGWVWTGDVARIDEDGYLWVMDRKKDVIITGGVNVYPKEVEDALGTHPAVADVAVVGQPHPEWGETVTAVVVAKPGQQPTAAELQEYARVRLADFKVPRLIRFADAIPRNASGKILKHVLRQNLALNR